MLHSAAARRVGAAIAVGAAVGVLTTSVIGIAALVRDRPWHGLGILLVVAVPMLAVGQLWAIEWVLIRRPPQLGSPLLRLPAATGVREAPGSCSSEIWMLVSAARWLLLRSLAGCRR